MMNLSLATYYANPKVTMPDQEERDAELRDAIERVRVEFPRAGYRPLMHYLGRNGIKQVWTADITYIRINNEFAYLAVILNLFSRKVIG